MTEVEPAPEETFYDAVGGAETFRRLVARFYAGVAEDPVTGSAHCVLAPFWAARTGRTTLTGQQASKRGGIVRMRLDGDRVHLGGKAVTVWSGHLHAAPPPN